MITPPSIAIFHVPDEDVDDSEKVVRKRLSSLSLKSSTTEKTESTAVEIEVPVIGTQYDFNRLWHQLVPSKLRPASEITEFSTFALDWTEWIVPDDDDHIGGGSFGEVYKGM